MSASGCKGTQLQLPEVAVELSQCAVEFRNTATMDKLMDTGSCRARLRTHLRRRDGPQHLRLRDVLVPAADEGVVRLELRQQGRCTLRRMQR